MCFGSFFRSICPSFVLFCLFVCLFGLVGWLVAFFQAKDSSTISLRSDFCLSVKVGRTGGFTGCQSHYYCIMTKEWLPCFCHKLKNSSLTKDWLIVNKTLQISHGACSLMLKPVQNKHGACSLTLKPILKKTFQIIF